ncbi:MAG: hypothetical protein AAGD96_13260 [Chloroflexota bacterium]
MVKRLYQLVFGVGILLTTLAAGIAIWPDLEAQNFSQTFRGRDRTRLSCPIAMTADEVSQVRISLNNPLERRVRFAAISFISFGGQTSTPAEDREEIYIEPGASDSVAWEIDRTNTVYGFMVLARVYVFRSGRVPSQAGTCGVWWIGADWASRLRLSGQALYTLLTAAGLGCLALGGVKVSDTRNPFSLYDNTTSRPRFGVVFSGALLLGLALGIWGMPLAALGALTLAVLLLLGLIDRPDF